MSGLKEYINDITTGKVLVDKNIYRLYVEILRPIVDGKDVDYYFDPEPGERFDFFCHTFCKQSKAPWAGKPLDLLTFQKAKYDALLGIKSRKTGNRRFTVMFDVVARKNGKSEEASAFNLYSMTQELGAEIYTVATILKQSRHLWDESVAFIDTDPWLSKHFGHRVFPNPEITLTVNGSTSSYFAIANTPDKQDGFNPSLVSIDEAHALKQENYDVLKQGTATRDEPLTIIHTSAGYIRNGLFDNLYKMSIKALNDPNSNPSFLPILYVLDNPNEINDEKCWIKANPGIGIIKKYSYLEGAITDAKANPSALNAVKVKDFNIIGIQNLSWFTAEEINGSLLGPYDKKEVDDPNFIKQFDGSMVIGGFDLSRTTDLTAFGILLFDPKKATLIYRCMYWVTQTFLKSDAFLASKAKEAFMSWIDQGRIRICSPILSGPNGEAITVGSSSINYHEITDYVVKEFQEHNYIFSKIMYDSYSAKYLVADLAAQGWSAGTGGVQEPVIQGFKSLSLPSQELQSILNDHRLCTCDDPVMQWMLSNAEQVTDRNANLMLKKAGDRSINKIDGVATLLNCLVEFCRNKDLYFNQ